MNDLWEIKITYSLVNGAKDVVHFTNLGLVLEEDWGVEVWNHLVDGLAHDVFLARMNEGTHLCQNKRKSSEGE
jgi:hypothetical protein